MLVLAEGLVQVAVPGKSGSEDSGSGRAIMKISRSICPGAGETALAASIWRESGANLAGHVSFRSVTQSHNASLLHFPLPVGDLHWASQGRGQRGYREGSRVFQVAAVRFGYLGCVRGRTAHKRSQILPPPPKTAHVGSPEKSLFASPPFPGKERSKATRINFFREMFWSKKGVLNGPFWATVHVFFPSVWLQCGAVRAILASDSTVHLGMSAVGS